jgi:hypothetical protein
MTAFFAVAFAKTISFVTPLAVATAAIAKDLILATGAIVLDTMFKYIWNKYSPVSV